VIGKVLFKEKMTDELPSSYITLSSEAYTLVYLENCYDTWMAEAVDKADKKVRSSYPRPLWTKDPQTAKIYRGWSEEGYARYNKVQKTLKKQRREQDTGEDLEKDFLEDAQMILEKTRKVKVRSMPVTFTNLYIEGGSDSEEDNTSDADDE
jgi:hypothetical protein